MKEMIYVPDAGEMIPDPAVYYVLPVSGKSVVHVIVDDDFTTDGELLYDSISKPDLGEPYIHCFL